MELSFRPSSLSGETPPSRPDAMHRAAEQTSQSLKREAKKYRVTIVISSSGEGVDKDHSRQLRYLLVTEQRLTSLPYEFIHSGLFYSAS